ncbi:MAG: HNH endonuclease domain-containing protein [Odoribacter sp.]
MKNICSLDLGTNSIGWAVISQDDEGDLKGIEGCGSRIIPMSQDILGNFSAGNSISQTAERTGFRGVRRLRERYLLRRERLLRILNLMEFLPCHYALSIGWDKNDHKTFAKYKTDIEPKIAWEKKDTGEYEFIFQDAFEEMLVDFSQYQPALVASERKVPYDWTIYYLRKKALENPITKEELAWIILNFNQKRGYYQLRGEEEENEVNKSIAYYALKVVEVQVEEATLGKSDIWYNVVLENGWIYHRSSKISLSDWIGKTKEFIVTTDLNDDGTPKKDKEGNEKRSFRMPSEDDWMLLKKKTEADIIQSEKTVGCYIYDTLLKSPEQKIRGKLVRTIERKFYKQELYAILKKQMEFHPELQDKELYQACIEELYPQNEAHRQNIANGNLIKFILEDIIFYQRPLKSKKSLISNCPYEYHIFIKEGERKISPLKCIAKSNPLFQEFRLWQFIQNLKIYENKKTINGKLQIDTDVTNEFLSTEEKYVELFDWLNNRKDITQKVLLKYLIKKKPELYRWNYVEDKIYPCNETRALMLGRLMKCNISDDFLSQEIEMSLWHLLYSVEDVGEVVKALKSFSLKHQLNDEFIEVFRKFPPFKNEYGAYSEKAVKKLLTLMRMGRYWNENAIDHHTIQRIEKLLTGEDDTNILSRIHKKVEHLTDISSFRGLPLWLACYVVYNRHSESGELIKWETPQDIDRYLNTEFKQHSLRNPIVEQVILETLRTVRDIWLHFGDISEIHIELGRDMKNPADKRAFLTEQSYKNENTNLRMKALLMELQNDPTVENVRPYSPGQQEILKIYEEGVLTSGIDLPEDIAKISKMNQPSQSELIRYKLWLEQKYCSPYTGEIISLGKLFTQAYEIEHIIPQSRYFDDSLSNKVICESEVNKLKNNLLGYEFIQKHRGEIVELSFGKQVKIFTENEYQEFVKKNYSQNRGKMQKLLLEDIPENFIQRQLNDSRYISKVVKSLLSGIVREEGEQEDISKNVIVCTGGITDRLKKDWGMTDVWNKIVTPRFVRLNEMTQSTKFGDWKNNYFQIQMPLELQKGFNKKRIDHRHHAMDALVIACATREHINYLNNESASIHAKTSRYDLQHLLCEKLKTDDKGNYTWLLKKPWATFTQDAYEALESIVVSFKQNLRVINKTTNHYQVYENGVKVMKLQEKGDRWAIRKSLHKDTVFGKVTLREKNQIRLSKALENYSMIVDKDLKKKIKDVIHQYGKEDIKLLIRYFKDRENKFNGKDISKVEVYHLDTERVASRKNLDSSFTAKVIENITDTGIQKILMNHLHIMDNNPELAFSPEGIDEMNKNMLMLNDGKQHQPIQKVRLFEPLGNKFQVGESGNKVNKFVVADKGTNLFFAIYQAEDGKRNYSTPPLNVVIERQKQGLLSVPETKMNGEMADALLFWLSPNDLVYVPTLEERENQASIDWNKLSKEQVKRIYKMVNSSGYTCFFVSNSMASSIVNKFEFSTQNKMEKTIEGEMIKEICWKLKVDRLGHIVQCISSPQ